MNWRHVAVWVVAFLLGWFASKRLRVWVVDPEPGNDGDSRARIMAEWREQRGLVG